MHCMPSGATYLLKRRVELLLKLGEFVAGAVHVGLVLQYLDPGCLQIMTTPMRFFDRALSNTEQRHQHWLGGCEMLVKPDRVHAKV